NVHASCQPLSDYEPPGRTTTLSCWAGWETCISRNAAMPARSAAAAREANHTSLLAIGGLKEDDKVPVRITHIKPPTEFMPVLITLHFRSPDDDRLILQRLVEAADIVNFKVEFARSWRTCRSRNREGREADDDLVSVQVGEVLGCIY